MVVRLPMVIVVVEQGSVSIIKKFDVVVFKFTEAVRIKEYVPIFEIVAPFICTFPPVELRLLKVIDEGLVVGVHVNVTVVPQFGVCVVKNGIVYG